MGEDAAAFAVAAAAASKSAGRPSAPSVPPRSARSRAANASSSGAAAAPAAGPPPPSAGTEPAEPPPLPGLGGTGGTGGAGAWGRAAAVCGRWALRPGQGALAPSWDARLATFERLDPRPVRGECGDEDFFVHEAMGTRRPDAGTVHPELHGKVQLHTADRLLLPCHPPTTPPSCRASAIVGRQRGVRIDLLLMARRSHSESRRPVTTVCAARRLSLRQVVAAHLRCRPPWPRRRMHRHSAPDFCVSGVSGAKIDSSQKALAGAPWGAASPSRTTRGMAWTIAGRNSLARRPTPEAEMKSAHVLLNLP